MSNLADRLKQRSAALSLQAQADETVKQRQVEVEDFISENAPKEFERLQDLIVQKITEVNPDLGDLPPYQFQRGWRMITQDNCVAGILFDKPYTNMATNRLAITFGSHPNAMYFFSAPPKSIRYMLQGAAKDDFSGIVWVGDLGELSSEQLSEFILETLSEYYMENKPGSR